MPNLPFTMTECWENYEIGRKYWIFLATKTAIKFPPAYVLIIFIGIS